jgi:hypothetical protein
MITTLPSIDRLKLDNAIGFLFIDNNNPESA